MNPGTWIDALVNNIVAVAKWVAPFQVVRVDEAFVVYRWGKPHRVMDAGFNLRIPFGVEKVQRSVISEKPVNLLSQSATTADGKPVTFSANIVYRIEDPILAQTMVQDVEEGLNAIAMPHLHARVHDKTWEGLMLDGKAVKSLEDSLKGTLTTRVQDWGLEIVSCGFTDLVAARPYRIFGDGMVQV